MKANGREYIAQPTLCTSRPEVRIEVRSYGFALACEAVSADEARQFARELLAAADRAEGKAT